MIIPQRPDLILIVCEGKTEVLYFRLLQKLFRLPSWVRIIPDNIEHDYSPLGQHEALIKRAREEADRLVQEDNLNIEVWAVCDRDKYKDSFTRLQSYADSLNVCLAFSDPQFENFLLQHFSANKSRSSNKEVEGELSQTIKQVFSDFALYKKTDLSWLAEMIDRKHKLVEMAVHNADMHTTHTKQPFFTIQKLVRRLLALVK